MNSRDLNVHTSSQSPARHRNPGDPEASTWRSCLLDLPSELLDFILDALDCQPLSKTSFIELPASAWISSEAHDLKNVSFTSRRLRRVTLPRLFRHARLNPAHLTEFLDFVHRAGVTSKIETIVADLQEPYYDVHPAWWCRLLNEIPITHFTIGGSPEHFADIAKIPLNLNDSWAFNVPYQYLELQQHPHIALQQVSYDELPSLLGAKQWHTIKVNEGSSLAAYTTFEYFLKKPPSLFSNIQTCLNVIPSNATLQITQKMFGSSALSVVSIQGMLASLSEFHFVAIFPFYNHVDDILKCIRRMRRLKKLFIKLCPQPERSVLDDEIKAAQGHFDINDPWNEWVLFSIMIAIGTGSDLEEQC